MNAASPPALSLGAALGRGDLLRLVARLGEASLEATAARFGYHAAPEAKPEPSAEPGLPSLEAVLALSAEAGLGEPETAPTETTTPTFEWAPLPFWRVEAFERRETGAEEGVRSVQPLSWQELTESTDGRCPTPRPIVPPSRLRGWLDAATRAARPGREVDAARIVQAWSRGEWLHAFPYRASQGTAGSVRLLVDTSERLLPFWDDQRDVERQLRRLVGRAALEAARGREPGARVWAAPKHRDSWPLRQVEPGQVVVVLGDLGFFGSEERRATWLRLGRELARSGARLHALVPCPPNRWQGSTARMWRATDWERPTGRQVVAGVRPSPEALERRALRLLCLLAPALRLEPALVRALRLLLGPDRSDLGTEADLWARPELLGPSAVGAAFEPEAQRKWRARFERLPLPVRERVLEVLASLHAYLPRELRDEEVVTGELLGGLSSAWQSRVADARLHLARLVRTRGAGGLPRAWVEALGERVKILSSRLPEAVWQEPNLGPSLQRALSDLVREDPGTPLPPGYVPPQEEGDADRRWRVIQQGDALLLEPWSPKPWDGPGSPIAEITGGAVLATQAERGWAVKLPVRGPLRFEPANPAPLILSTSRETLRLGRMERPNWATAAGRDRFGLWAAFEVKGVEHRMRWIPPGRFWMGSPAEEVGRHQDEGPQCEVTVESGFWLGQLPCTQALWQAVTGKNPSEFRSPDRAVEQVSWNDCWEFLEALQRRMSGLAFGLPTEAEWEYSCRAGTTSSTYASELVGADGVGMEVPFDLGWFDGNSREGFDLGDGWDSPGWTEAVHPRRRWGSRRLGEKTPNAWGLFDMLGNVWEWCQDLYASYPSSTVSSSREPARGAFRVVRGGAWNSSTLALRAAMREGRVVSYRSSSVGFRLLARRHLIAEEW